MSRARQSASAIRSLIGGSPNTNAARLAEAPEPTVKKFEKKYRSIQSEQQVEKVYEELSKYARTMERAAQNLVSDQRDIMLEAACAIHTTVLPILAGRAIRSARNKKEPPQPSETKAAVTPAPSPMCHESLADVYCEFDKWPLTKREREYLRKSVPALRKRGKIPQTCNTVLFAGLSNPEAEKQGRSTPRIWVMMKDCTAEKYTYVYGNLGKLTCQTPKALKCISPAEKVNTKTRYFCHDSELAGLFQSQ